jgi:hypothetical protein
MNELIDRGLTARNEREAWAHLSAAAEARGAERARWMGVLGGRAGKPGGGMPANAPNRPVARSMGVGACGGASMRTYAVWGD